MKSNKMTKQQLITRLYSNMETVQRKQRLANKRAIKIAEQLPNDVLIDTYGLEKSNHNLNLGKVAEIVLKVQLGEKAKFSPQGEKDLQERKLCPEIKTCLCSNEYGTDMRNLEQGVTMITDKGVYTLNCKVIKKLIKEKPIDAVKVDKNGAIKLKRMASTNYGKRNNYLSKLLGM